MTDDTRRAAAPPVEPPEPPHDHNWLGVTHDWRDHSSTPHHHDGEDIEPIWDVPSVPPPVREAGLRKVVADFIAMYNGQMTEAMLHTFVRERLEPALLAEPVPLDVERLVMDLPHWKYAGHAALVDRGEVLAILARLTDPKAER